MSAPVVPPRPTRAHAGPTAVKQDTPQVPPRPIRKLDPSPDRDTRSPLNFLPGANGAAWQPPKAQPSVNGSARRPSNVTVPAQVGEEGVEYASYDQLPEEARVGDEAPAAAEQTRNVSADLPIHQPKASVPQSTAKSRIATVTRTDSTQAAAAGIGKAQPDDDVHKAPEDTSAPISRVTSRTFDDHHRPSSSAEPHALRAKASFNRSSTSLHNGTPRPPSIHSQDYHEGIPEIGQQIPLYPNAGDVQAPSPAPTQSQFPPGIGFFNDGSARAHQRRRSSRQEFGPPGSYGLHHSSEPQDQFERDWIAKHPDEAAKEGYHPYMTRPESALSSEQLNRIVSDNLDVGMGTSPAMIGTPSQDIAFEASEQFASRLNSPRPISVPLSERKKRSSGDHFPATESPLRKTAFSAQETARMRNAVDSEDDDVIHIDPPVRRGHKVTGGGAMDNTFDLGPTGGNTEELGGFIDEEGRGTPILASDEVLKRPSSAFLEPAVEASPARSVDDYAYDHAYDSDDMPAARRSSLKPPSRPSSRPNSMHGYQGGPLHRYISHEEHHASGMGTPLEEIEEYEPLFPENEETGETQPKREFRQRPGLAHHHFPSSDVWEDTPSSLQYSTTVQTPEPAPEKIAAADGAPSKVFETPEQEEARRKNNPADMLSDSKTLAKPHFKPGVLEEQQAAGRPIMRPRFPSRDIWEDTPDSMRLVTTVSTPEMDEVKSPPEDRPTTSALPMRQDDAEARSTTGLTQLMQPSIPARPERRSKLAQEITPTEDERSKEVPDPGNNQEQLPDRTKPTIPERPKPTVPARPARSLHTEQAREAPATSPEGTSTAPAAKPKPIVPARPAGSKIAAMQATFMNDLNNRLKLGPQAPPPKAKEPEAEPEVDAPKEPLSDARKGRARGPARRKPATTAEAGAFSFSTTMTLWQIDETDELQVSGAVAAATDTAKAETTSEPATVKEPAETLELEKQLSANEAKNTEEPPMQIASSEQQTRDESPGDALAGSVDTVKADPSHAPAPEPSISAEEEEKPNDTVSTAVQTGQQDMEITSPEGEKTKMTAYLDGHKQEGNVLVKHDEQ